MSLTQHAKRELQLAGLFDTDSDYGGMVAEAVMELMEVFSKQGHSGYSALMVASIFDKLAKYQTLAPLTGKEDEWNEVARGVYQNNRCGTIFKDSTRFNGRPYTIEGKVFSDDGGISWFTNSDSCVEITFPYQHKEPERIILK